MFESTIPRAAMTEFRRKLKPGKVLVLMGPRRVGKTALIQSYLHEVEAGDVLLLNGEDLQTHQILENRSVQHYRQVLGKHRIFIIDEAQKVPDIGLKLKLMVDHFPEVSFLATGSSVFDLSNQLGEPLVGRSNTLWLFPLAQMEFSVKENYVQTISMREERLLYGGYPELTHYPDQRDKEEYLRELINGYLLKDILEYEGVQKSVKMLDILRLLAYQVGSEVNIEELARSAKGIARNTAERYLDLLEKVFVIYKVQGFCRNLRKEVTKNSRYYFWDNGVRNALIGNFRPLNLRDDAGALWENYLMAERMKCLNYSRRFASRYFWRTYDQQEIDLVEEEAGALHAFEFKYQPGRKVKAPGAWKRAYPDASFQVITPDNYLEFIMP